MDSKKRCGACENGRRIGDKKIRCPNHGIRNPDDRCPEGLFPSLTVSTATGNARQNPSESEKSNTEKNENNTEKTSRWRRIPVYALVFVIFGVWQLPTYFYYQDANPNVTTVIPLIIFGLMNSLIFSLLILSSNANLEENPRKTSHRMHN